MRITSIQKRVSDWIIPVSLTLFLFCFMKYVVLVGYVPSESMEPTLPKGSVIIGSRVFHDLHTGDIIVFNRNGMLMVKRIAAGPGETIDLSSLEYMNSLPKPKRTVDSLTIPEDCYFVLGDNAQNSLDSRYWEDPFVQSKSIFAKLAINERSATIWTMKPY